jgi:hypothetical protein
LNDPSQFPNVKKVLEIFVLAFFQHKIRRNIVVVVDLARRLVRTLVLIVIVSIVRVNDETLEGHTGDTLFHTPHRMPKVGGQESIPVIIIVVVRLKVLIGIGCGAQPSCFFCFIFVIVLQTKRSSSLSPQARLLGRVLLVFENNVQRSSVFEGSVVFVLCESALLMLRGNKPSAAVGDHGRRADSSSVGDCLALVPAGMVACQRWRRSRYRCQIVVAVVAVAVDVHDAAAIEWAGVLKLCG